MKTKPPFHIPSMTDVRTVKRNGLKVISTFAGAGGSSLGYRMAGFEVLWANEFVEEARETYESNAAAGTVIDPRDIRIVKGVEILKLLGMKPGELDVFDGSPPCAAFSQGGMTKDTWGKIRKYSDVKQRTDDLFDEYIRLLGELQPKVFVAENVPGIAKGVSKGVFIDILTKMKAKGYRVECRILDARWLGVPQVRKRAIFMGVRNDLKKDPVFPKPLPYLYTVGEIFPLIRRIQTGERNMIWRNSDEPMGCVAASDGLRTHRALVEVEVSGMMRRRKLTIEELKAICGFPKDFELTGKYAQQYERLGRAVPPLMMRAVAEGIRDHIL